MIYANFTVINVGPYENFHTNSAPGSFVRLYFRPKNGFCINCRCCWFVSNAVYSLSQACLFFFLDIRGGGGYRTPPPSPRYKVDSDPVGSRVNIMMLEWYTGLVLEVEMENRLLLCNPSNHPLPTGPATPSAAQPTRPVACVSVCLSVCLSVCRVCSPSRGYPRCITWRGDR